MTSLFVETVLDTIIRETSILIRTIESLQRRGYTDEYDLHNEKIVNKRTGKSSRSGELVVDEILCCDQQGCDGFTIYVLRDPQENSKGILTILIPPFRE